MRPFYLLLAFVLSTIPSLAQSTPAAPDATPPDEQSTAINTAIVPIAKEQTSIDWWQRHNDALSAKDRIHPQIVLIGDSITQYWDGEPISAKHKPRGPKAWKEAFGDMPVLNLGFEFDRTQNVLWRLDHAEFDLLTPKWVVINIGTNNLVSSGSARGNTPQEIVAAILAICDRVHTKSPGSKIIVMAIFPRDAKPDGPHRATGTAVNAALADAVKTHPEITYLDIGASFLQPDGSLPKDMMSDGTNPTDKGYSIWAKALVAAGIQN